DNDTLKVHRALEIKLQEDPQFLENLVLPHHNIPPVIQFASPSTRPEYVKDMQDNSLNCLIPDVYRDIDDEALIAAMQTGLKRASRALEEPVEERQPVTDR